jgi:hypothetical protein
VSHTTAIMFCTFLALLLTSTLYDESQFYNVSFGVVFSILPNKNFSRFTLHNILCACP